MKNVMVVLLGLALTSTWSVSAVSDQSETPCWVKSKGRCLGSDRRTIYGVGKASGIADSSLLRSSAREAAEKDLLLQMEWYYYRLAKIGAVSYTESVEIFRDVSKAVMRRAELAEFWESSNGIEGYALLALDLERLRGELSQQATVNSANGPWDAALMEAAYAQFSRWLDVSPKDREPLPVSDRGRDVLSKSVFLPVVDGRVSPIPATDFLGKCDIVEIAHNDLLRLDGGRHASGLTRDDVVRVIYADLIRLADGALPGLLLSVRFEKLNQSNMDEVLQANWLCRGTNASAVKMYVMAAAMQNLNEVVTTWALLKGARYTSKISAVPVIE